MNKTSLNALSEAIKEAMESSYAKKTAIRVAVITVAINVFLSAFKILAGFIGHSNAMVSDGVHSASDVVSTIIVIIGVILAGKPLDKQHQYGHERLECVASVILSLLLFLTGAVIGYSGIKELITGEYLSLPKPTLLPLIAAIVSIAVKEGMFWYAYTVAKKINSLSLKADAWHHRSDALSSVASLLAIALATYFGLFIADVIVALIICAFIVKVAVEIFIEATDKMVDKACPEETVEKIRQKLGGIDGVIKIDDIKTRMFGNKIYVDVEISADGELKLFDSHAIAQRAHDEIESLDDRIKHCMVHVNPAKVKKDGE